MQPAVQRQHDFAQPQHDNALSDFLQHCVGLFACVNLLYCEIFLRLQRRVAAF
jgi:hypothetical protein